MMIKFLARNTLILFVVLANHLYEAGSPQKRLLNKLFKNYNKMERPVENDKQTLNINLGLAVQQLVNIRWNPEDFAGDSFDSLSKVNAVVEHTGDIAYIPPGMFKTTCNFKIKEFPFDSQKCSLKIGSWTYDDRTINVTNKSDRGQKSSYIKNPEWILEDIISYGEAMSYECCPEKYPYVMFDIYIRRRTLYYEFNLIFPCIFISCLTLFGFLLPPDCNEKIVLEVTTLLVLITFSQIILNAIPVSSLSLSRIGLYFLTITLLSGFSILTNILVLIIHHSNVKIDNDMPKWVETLVFKYLVKLLRMELPLKLRKSNAKRLADNQKVPIIVTSSSIDANHRNASTSSASIYANELSEHHSNCNMHHNSLEYLSNVEPKLVNKASLKTDINSIKRSLYGILQSLCYVTKRMEENTENDERQLRCKFAALVIDRLCIVIFTVLLFLSTAIIFMNENFLKNSDPYPNF